MFIYARRPGHHAQHHALLLLLLLHPAQNHWECSVRGAAQTVRAQSCPFHFRVIFFRRPFVTLLRDPNPYPLLAPVYLFSPFRPLYPPPPPGGTMILHEHTRVGSIGPS